jgi:cation diffusion facilitator family transporter
MNWIRTYSPQPGRSELYRRALVITVAGNVLLAAGKGIAAYLTGSAALYADAANSISDVLYSILMVWGLAMAQRPPDISHPQGHSRFEPMVGLMVTLSMAFAGFEAARNAYFRFAAGGMAVEPGLPTVILLAAAAIKLGMFLSIRSIAAQLQSPTLKTTAQDHLSDVLTSIAAFLGVLGSHLHPLLDPLAGFAVAAWIFRASFRAGKENFAFLTGAGASQELRERIVEEASAVEGVLAVHHTMTEYVGPQLVVDIHINVDGNKTLNESHAISDAVIDRLEALPEVDRAYVHVEPEGWD